nr:SMC-Scp complex subunit ScpB [Roseibium sp. RKSG952]
MELELEALLVATTTPLKQEALSREIGPMFENAVSEIEAFWSGRGMTLGKTKDGIALVPDPDCIRVIEERRGDPMRHLSPAALQTLSFIAINQPVTYKDIEGARGVVLSKKVLDGLMDAGYVRASRRRSRGGGAISYVTTDHFLEHFGLTALSDLPNPDELEDLTNPPETELDGEGDAAPA